MKYTESVMLKEFKTHFILQILVYQTEDTEFILNIDFSQKNQIDYEHDLLELQCTILSVIQST